MRASTMDAVAGRHPASTPAAVSLPSSAPELAGCKVPTATAAGPPWRFLCVSSRELRLEFTLPTGQSFRWRQTGTDQYTGVIGTRVVQMLQTPDDVLYRVLARGDISASTSTSTSTSTDTGMGAMAEPQGSQARSTPEAGCPQAKPPQAAISLSSSIALPATAGDSSADLSGSPAAGSALQGSCAAAADEDDAAIRAYFNLTACSRLVTAVPAGGGSVVGSGVGGVNGASTLAELADQWCAGDARFAAISPYFPGARMLRQDPVECLFQFICSSNNHISRIHGMVERLCSSYGTLLPLSQDCLSSRLQHTDVNAVPLPLKAMTAGDKAAAAAQPLPVQGGASTAQGVEHDCASSDSTATAAAAGLAAMPCHADMPDFQGLASTGDVGVGSDIQVRGQVQEVHSAPGAFLPPDAGLGLPQQLVEVSVSMQERAGATADAPSELLPGSAQRHAGSLRTEDDSAMVTPGAQRSRRSNRTPAPPPIKRKQRKAAAATVTVADGSTVSVPVDGGTALTLEPKAAAAVSGPDGLSFYAFPTLEQLSRATEQELRAAGFGYRAKYIVGSVAMLLAKEGGGHAWLLGLRNLPYKTAVEQLCVLPGIGPKVAACVCLFSLDKHEAIPVDTHVWQIATRYYLPHLRGKALTKKVHDDVQQAFEERFGSYAGWAHNTLFISELASQQKRLPPALQQGPVAGKKRKGQQPDSPDTSSDEEQQRGKQQQQEVQAAVANGSQRRRSR